MSKTEIPASAASSPPLSAPMDIDKVPEVTPDIEGWFVSELKYHVGLLEKSVTLNEPRFMTRVLRMTSSLRKLLDVPRLKRAVMAHLPNGSTLSNELLQCLDTDWSDSAMQVDDDQTAAISQKLNVALPELEMYFGFLVSLYLHDRKEKAAGAKLSMELVNFIRLANRRTLDQLAARIFFYHVHFHSGITEKPVLRSRLFALLRTAVLRQDKESTATLINMLLHSFLDDNLVEQADKLLSKTTFPEYASNNQTARYMYYQGRIKALHLDYSNAHRYLQLAIRKAPQIPATLGFLQATTKLSIIVQLLLGEVPDRATFRMSQLRTSLASYRHLVTAVRNGDLALFQATLSASTAQFAKDKTLSLIQRLRHNVIKTGIRLISLSYSCISLRDLCLKLALESEEDAEYMVAKAISDGVIDAVIDHEKGHVRSKENTEIYSTREPLAAFHQRITFCLGLHNESVKAMRYPTSAHKKLYVDSEEAREIAKELEMHLEDEHDDY